MKKAQHISHKNYFGFTLVELLVVITILAVLATIAFVSIQGFSSTARDSKRISDVGSLVKILDLYEINAGNYPTPDDVFAVTYSGGVVWNQGIIGAGVLQKTRGVLLGGGISEVPLDPLSNSEYVYSTLAFGKEYQIMARYEGDTVARTIPFVEFAHAAPGSPELSYIKGNYNGIIAKTQTGLIVYILPSPSIVSLTGAAGQAVEISENTLAGMLTLNGLSSSSGITFNPNNTSLIYEGASMPSNASEQLDLAMRIAQAYSGTAFSNYASVQPFVEALTAFNSGALLTSLGQGLVSGALNGSYATAPASSDPEPSLPPAETTFSLSVATAVVGASIEILHDCTSSPTGYASSNTSVATISSNTITAVGAGTTEITPIGGNCTDSTAKTLSVIPSTTFSFSTQMVIGRTSTIFDACMNSPTGYTSSNTSVATISANVITAVSTGTTTIAPIGGDCTDSAPKTLTVLAWRMSGGDCTYVDNTVGIDGDTGACTDPRTYAMPGPMTHNRRYELIKIGGVWWFNENLAYPPATGYGGWSATDTGKYACPGDCSGVGFYGFLYQWSAAMAGEDSTDNPGSRRQGICPSGWGIPTKSDFSTAGSTYWPDTGADGEWLGSPDGWMRRLAGNIYGAGEDRQGLDEHEYFWSSQDTSGLEAWSIRLHSFIPESYRGIFEKSTGHSVRCIKN